MSELNDFKIIGGKVTVDQAAWMTKKSNQAIYNAIKDGRLSAEVTDRAGKSVKVVQVVDLERLYQDLRYPGNVPGQGASEGRAASISTPRGPVGDIAIEHLMEMMENRFKSQMSQYQDEVEYLREAHEKAQETTSRMTMMLEDKSKETEKGEKWEQAFKALESRIANQEQQAQTEKEKTQKILRQNQSLKKALEEERNKPLLAKLFGPKDSKTG